MRLGSHPRVRNQPGNIWSSHDGAIGECGRCEAKEFASIFNANIKKRFEGEGVDVTMVAVSCELQSLGKSYDKWMRHTNEIDLISLNFRSDLQHWYFMTRQMNFSSNFWVSCLTGIYVDFKFLFLQAVLTITQRTRSISSTHKALIYAICLLCYDGASPKISWIGDNSHFFRCVALSRRNRPNCKGE